MHETSKITGLLRGFPGFPAAIIAINHEITSNFCSVVQLILFIKKTRLHNNLRTRTWDGTDSI